MGKLENNYVKELVDYYKNIGVDKFILGDNNDKDSNNDSNYISETSSISFSEYEIKYEIKKTYREI